MPSARQELPGQLAARAGRALSRLDVLALFPLAALSGLWLDLADLVTLTAFVLPGLLALRAIGQAAPGAQVVPVALMGDAPPSRDRGAVPGRAALLSALGRAAAVPGHDSACILLHLDGWDRLLDRIGSDAAERVAHRCAERLATALRGDDLVARLGDARFGIVLHPARGTLPATREAITTRLRATLAEPIALDGITLRLTACGGQSGLWRDHSDVAAASFAAAEAALTEARRSGPNTQRAYAPGLLQRHAARARLAAGLADALSAGQVEPWFQPQFAAQGGALSGLAALALWPQSDRGPLSLADLSLEDRAQMMQDPGGLHGLANVLLAPALDTLRALDAAGLALPCVSVAAGMTDLRSPAFADRVLQELQRTGLAPARLMLTLPEPVAAPERHAGIEATLDALGRAGVGLEITGGDLGPVRLAALRRLGVGRLRIAGRSTRCIDNDTDRQAEVSALVSMARTLGLPTLAEGVETQAARDLLAGIGCDHVQGSAPGAAMSRGDMMAWAARRAAAPARPLRPARRPGHGPRPQAGPPIPWRTAPPAALPRAENAP
jgi:diguanylate cyclase (GGDEF)-like protein